MTYTKEQIEKVLALADKATPGPFFAVHCASNRRNASICTGTLAKHRYIAMVTTGGDSDEETEQRDTDCEFLTSAHTMAAIIRQLVAERDDLIVSKASLDSFISDAFRAHSNLDLDIAALPATTGGGS